MIPARECSICSTRRIRNEDTEKGYIYYLREKELRIFKAGELNSERYYLRAIPAAQLTIYENKGQVLTQNRLVIP